MADISRQRLDEICARLTGPVHSIPTTFNADGSIDWNGVGNTIDVAVGAGSSVMLLTPGDSQFLFMADAEVVEINRFVIERARRHKVLVVAAAGLWWTGQAVALARQCREWGADIMMTLPSPYATDPAALEQHYRAVAAEMPVMHVGAYPHAVIDRLLDIPNLCCFKEDGTEAFAVQAIQRYGKAMTIMTGGQLWRFVTQQPYGVRAYMDWTLAVAPKVSARFARAAQAGDVAALAAVVRDVETPFQALAGNAFYTDNSGRGARTFPSGWNGLWRAALEVNGVAKRFLRGPQANATDADVEQVCAAMQRIGLIV